MNESKTIEVTGATSVYYVECALHRKGRIKSRMYGERRTSNSIPAVKRKDTQNDDT